MPFTERILTAVTICQNIKWYSKAIDFFSDLFAVNLPFINLTFGGLACFQTCRCLGESWVAACCEGPKVRVKSQEKVEGVREPALWLLGPIWGGWAPELWGMRPGVPPGLWALNDSLALTGACWDRPVISWWVELSFHAASCWMMWGSRPPVPVVWRLGVRRIAEVLPS